MKYPDKVKIVEVGPRDGLQNEKKNITTQIKEWDRDIRIMLEEAGFYGENGFRYVNKRQTEIKPIYFN